MTLAPGTRLGPYEITGAIGAGGMGEVFRARDTKLNRDVAIKVLPAAFADDPERLARFTREAQTLASLNHPNIATIHGIEEVPAATGRSRALVMELVEGEDLSAHIARGPIPIAEALPIARQIAEALEAAHELGIVHRDLKPANIKVRTDGTVKVLDFGLAKAMDPAGASGSNPNVSHSPTLTHQGTSAGIIMGTAAYMSPEQAKGRSVDKRTDIWAFGVVLYEMLAGTRCFQGEDVSDTLAAVLRQEISLKALPADAPPRLTRLIARCLDRDRKTRLRDIGEARIEIARIEAGGPDSAASAPTTAAAGSAARLRLLSASCAVLTIALISGLFAWAPWRPTPVPAPRKLLTSIGADASLRGDGAPAVLSPDGATLAFAARQAGQTRLFTRKLDQLQAVALAGTEGASIPFFSPDGRWIAFFAGTKLKKVPVMGGATVHLCDAQNPRGGAWTDDDTIIFASANGPNTRLTRVSAAGGTPSVFGTPDEGAVSQRWPQALPGGKGVLYTENSTGTGGWDGANLVIAPLAGGMPKVVVRGGYYGRYLPSGHLVYMQQGTLFAAPFDSSRLETTGQAVPALEGIDASSLSGGAKLAFSSEGTLVHVPGGAAAANPIDWMTRDGKTSQLRATKAEWASPRFSADGQKLALDIFDGKQRDIWVYEWARDTLTQLTFGPGQDGFPVWTPDGRRIAFSSDRAQPGVRNLYWVNADGTGEVTRLTDSPEDQVAFSWHRDGKFLAFNTDRGATSWDLMILPMEGDAVRGLTPGKAAVLLSTPARETHPMFSPDGRWIAYASNEAGGRDDIYVRPFPGPGGKWRISTTGGGLLPQWSATAHELLFVSQGKVMFAPYAVVGDSFRAEKPQIWSPTGFVGLGSNYPYDLHPDGKRLAIIAAPDEGAGVAQDKVVFFFGFGDYLKKIAPFRE
jgi:serine/threonine-protein kinase